MRDKILVQCNGKRRKWRIWELSTDRGEAMRRDYDLASKFDQKILLCTWLT